jgi:hypothetical protein
MGAFIASTYPYIYSNIDVKHKWKSILTKKIDSLSDIEHIKFQDKKAIVMVDEWWVNINSRRFMTEANLEFSQLAMLWRKKNVDICIITQREFMIDKNFRELAKFVISMRAYFVWYQKLMFEFKISAWGIFKKAWKIDLMKWGEMTNFTYDTLDSARIS